MVMPLPEQRIRCVCFLLWVVVGSWLTGRRRQCVLAVIATGLVFITCRGVNGAILIDLATVVTMVREAKMGKLKVDYPVKSIELFGTIRTDCEELFN